MVFGGVLAGPGLAASYAKLKGDRISITKKNVKLELRPGVWPLVFPFGKRKIILYVVTAG